MFERQIEQHDNIGGRSRLDRSRRRPKELCPIGSRGCGKRRVDALEQIGEVGTGERQWRQLRRADAGQT